MIPFISIENLLFIIALFPLLCTNMTTPSFKMAYIILLSAMVKIIA